MEVTSYILNYNKFFLYDVLKYTEIFHTQIPFNIWNKDRKIISTHSQIKSNIEFLNKISKIKFST